MPDLASIIATHKGQPQMLAEALSSGYGWPPPPEVSQELAKAHLSFIGPYPGPQTEFLKNSADVVIYGGALGGGKTIGLLLQPLHYLQTHPNYAGVIFRETKSDIRKPGSLWDKSVWLYGGRGKPRRNLLDWSFKPYGNRLQFSQLFLDGEEEDWRGADLAYIGFDELTHFREHQFVFLMTRNRTASGAPPIIRATTNPDRRSWVFRWCRPWVDPEHPFFNQVDYGQHLHFRRVNEAEETPPEIKKDLLYRDGSMCWMRPGSPRCKTLSYIKSTLEDNPTYAQDESYKSSIDAQDRITRIRSWGGDEAWLVREDAGEMFRREWWTLANPGDVPVLVAEWRVWDLACAAQQARIRGTNRPASGKLPDFTATCRVGIDMDGVIWITALEEFRGDPATVESRMAATARADGTSVPILIEQERAGSAGPLLINAFASGILKGHRVEGCVPGQGKIERARPLSAALQRGEVKLVRSKMAPVLIKKAEEFPEGSYDDIVDAVAWGVLKLRGILRADGTLPRFAGPRKPTKQVRY